MMREALWDPRLLREVVARLKPGSLPHVSLDVVLDILKHVRATGSVRGDIRNLFIFFDRYVPSSRRPSSH